MGYFSTIQGYIYRNFKQKDPNMSYARECIAKIAGYVPGEQPQGKPLVKLNTNENPYPPSPKVAEAAAHFDIARLRLYPEPSSKMAATLKSNPAARPITRPSTQAAASTARAAR